MSFIASLRDQILARRSVPIFFQTLARLAEVESILCASITVLYRLDNRTHKCARKIPNRSEAIPTQSIDVVQYGVVWVPAGREPRGTSVLARIRTKASDKMSIRRARSGVGPGSGLRMSGITWRSMRTSIPSTRIADDKIPAILTRQSSSSSM